MADYLRRTFLFLVCWPLLKVYRPKSLDRFIRWGGYAYFPPWRKFKPILFHHDDGRQWEIIFSDKADYSTWGRTLRCEIMHAHDTHEVVGLKIYDEELVAKAKEMQAKHPQEPPPCQ